MNKKDLYKIIDSIVEKRISKIVPMLVEHEVHRLLRENKLSKTNTSRIDDKPNELKNINLKEHFSKLISAPTPNSLDSDNNRTLSYNTSNTHVGVTSQVTGLDGRLIDTSNENVSKVMNAMNKDYSALIQTMNSKSKNRGFI